MWTNQNIAIPTKPCESIDPLPAVIIPPQIEERNKNKY